MMGWLDKELELAGREIQNNLSWKGFWVVTAIISSVVTAAMGIGFLSGMIPVDPSWMVNFVMAGVTAVSSGYQANAYDQDNKIKAEKFQEELINNKEAAELEAKVQQLTQELEEVQSKQEIHERESTKTVIPHHTAYPSALVQQPHKQGIVATQVAQQQQV